MWKILILFFVFIQYTLYSQVNMPDWVNRPPQDTSYYIGIGICLKSSEQYDVKAREDALNEIAGKIGNTIESNSLLSTIQKKYQNNYYLQQSFKEEIKTFVKKSFIKDYEILDKWEDNNEYRVYCRLSKEKRRSQIAIAINASLASFKEAKEKESKKFYSDALLLYIKAIIDVESYLNEPLIAYNNNNKIDILFDSYTAIQKILKQIIVIKPDEEYNFKLDKVSNKIVKANVFYISPVDLKENPISGIPVSFSFIKGKGGITSKSLTKDSGEAEYNINNISSSEKTQIIKAEIDILDLIPETYHTELIQEIFGSLIKPNTHIIINSLPLTIYLNSNEDLFGEKTHLLSDAIKSVLAKDSLNPTNEKKESDWQVNIDVKAEVNGFMNDLYSSSVKGTISLYKIVNNQNINIIYQNQISLKGFWSKLNNNLSESDNYKKAAKDAIKNGKDTIYKIAVKYLEYIKKQE